jgi:hypothetical protein
MFGLLDDLFEQIDVAGEGLAPGGGQSISRLRFAVLKALGYRHIAGFLQGAHVHAQIAIGHPQGIPYLGETQLGCRRQQRHNRQAAPLVDDAIELEHRVWIHLVLYPFSVR